LSNFLNRTVTGFFIVLLIIGGISLSSVSFFFLFLFILIAGMFEFYKMSRMMKVRPQKYFGVLIGVLFFVLNFLYAVQFLNQKYFFLFLPLVFLIFINELYLKQNRPFTNIAYTFLGLLYVALPLSLLNYFIFSTNGESLTSVSYERLDAVNFIFQPEEQIVYSPQILLGFFILFWVNDTAAYLFGTALGKHRLFKRISPRKTWEGLLGGVFIALVASYLISIYFKDLSLPDWLMITFIVIIVGTFGDLVESMYKRSLGLKNSGRILPGHGGILDRFDGVLLSSPIVFTYLQLIK
jgi:phosphatidate cytidylyltransferase